MKDLIFNSKASFIIIGPIRKGALSREIKKKTIETKGELLDPETIHFKTLRSESRIHRKKRSNKCTSIVGNVHLSSVHFDQ